MDYPVIEPDEKKMDHLVSGIQKKFGLELLGIDVIIENGTGRYGVIDINAFPGTVTLCVRRCLSVWGWGTPLHPLSIYFLIFSRFYFFLSFLGFTYFLLLSIPSLSTRIVPLRFQAGGRRRRPNLGLVCFFV